MKHRKFTYVTESICANFPFKNYILWGKFLIMVIYVKLATTQNTHTVGYLFTFVLLLTVARVILFQSKSSWSSVLMSATFT